MNRRTISMTIAASMATLILVSGCGDRPAEETSQRHTTHLRAERVKALYIAGLERLDTALALFESTLWSDTTGDMTALHARFDSARLAYKRVEAVAEHYNAATAKLINGPALDDMKEDDPTRVIPPQGFQVIEEGLFPEMAPENREHLLMETGVLRANVRRLRNSIGPKELNDMQVFDALRLEIARVITLGLAGFDSPVAGHSLSEAAAALDGVRVLLTPYMTDLRGAAPELHDSLGVRFVSAITYLGGNGDVDSFDRLEFITAHANPLARLILDAQRALAVPLPTDRRAFVATVATVFDSGAFNPWFYAPNYAGNVTPEKVELGRLLFFDPILSANLQRACASCHIPERAFTDGRDRSITFAGTESVMRNAPTIINAGLQSGAFLDLRTTFVEDQAAAVLINVEEMHGSLEEAVRTIARSPDYAARFARAFPNEEKPLNEASLRAAIASYVRSLTSLNAPFDRYVRGDRTAMTSAVRDGFNLFMGKAKCGTCHFAPLFNGTVPPTYRETEVEILGVPAQWGTPRAQLDPDVGRYAVYKLEVDRFAFKTPTLRNVELTAPYMHNGAFRTLEEVIEFYDRGGGQGIGIEMERQTLPPDPLELTVSEKRSLIAFMRALTDTVGTTSRPAALPSFPGIPALDRRPIGGSY